jgi:glycogen phosphorylase
MTALDRTLEALAYNLWWSWDTDATALWEEIDPFRWARHRNNPVALLRDVEPERLASLARDPAFMARVSAVEERFRAYLHGDTWTRAEVPALHDRTVAYFSMEFGLHESLLLYSGGLGVLAGDHLRSASDLGVPLVGVSLLYRSGYFRQFLDDGRQVAAFPEAEWGRLPIRPCLGARGEPLLVVVPLANRLVQARLWELHVGRCRLILLDTDIEPNGPAERELTRSLYGGDDTTRICQELVLGIGGVRALRALGIAPSVFHLNEGHCAFVPVALLAEELAAGHRPEAGLARVRARCVFTTHTPVPAGHDRFSRELVEGVLGPWSDQVGLPRNTLMALGRVHEADVNERLCMTVVALKSTAASNGVSALHGAVSRDMWRALWPAAKVDEVPIHHVTNGVHPVFWMAPEARELFDRALPGWRDRPWDEGVWAGVDRIADSDWLALRGVLRRRLVHQIALHSGRRFDPDALTIGFARRFASYKRGNLLFRDPARLAALFADHPVQLVFAGKAHPRDQAGKDLITDVVRHSESTAFRDRVVLLPDYDMRLGRLITAGADVWLNNPRRPQEASGTSGQKVILNGGINLSVLDGWWPEGFDGTNGWAIGAGESFRDEAEQDAFDAEALYQALERQVLPTWSEPERWIATIRRSVRTCAPRFNSHRMVRDYVLQFYVPQLP